MKLPRQSRHWVSQTRVGSAAVAYIENSDDQRSDIAENPFPPPPFAKASLLRPIRSWSEMVREMQITGVDFDEHWYSCVMDEIAYFYQWHGTVRATVLVIFNADKILHIESRQFDDQLVPEFEHLLIIDEISAILGSKPYPETNTPQLH